MEIDGIGAIVTGGGSGLGEATTRELARRLDGSGVTVNAVHPGGVSTGLGANNGVLLHRILMTLLRPFMKSPAQGAATSIYLASSPDVDGTTGEYFANRKSIPGSKESQSTESAKRLWETSEQMTGLA